MTNRYVALVALAFSAGFASTLCDAGEFLGGGGTIGSRHENREILGPILAPGGWLTNDLDLKCLILWSQATSKREPVSARKSIILEFT